jgi:hypothetical protein
MKAMKKRQCELQRLSNSPTNRAVKTIGKGLEIALQGVAIFTEENKRLRAANARVIRKRAKKVKYLTQYESLTIQEGIEALEQPPALQIAAQISGGDCQGL